MSSALHPATVLADLGMPPLPQELPRPLIDAHTHLDSVADVAGLGVDDNLAAAAAVGIEKVVTIGCDLSDSTWAAAAAAQYPMVAAAVALHPNEAGRLSDAQIAAQLPQIEALLDGARVRAIGETGLDYYRTRDPDAQARQRRCFAAHIELALEHEVTLAIHDRDAHSDVLAVLDEVGVPQRTIMHCFSGDADFATACVARGAYLSFAGTVTYKNARELVPALHATPVDRLLVETDAPYLTPMPHRGKRNASYLIAHTVRFMAAELGIELGELCDQLSANAAAAYGGAW